MRSTGTRWSRLTTFDVAGQTLGLRLDRIDPDVIGTAALTLTGSVSQQAVSLKKFAVESDVLTVNASGKGDFTEQAYDFAFGLATPDLAAVAAAYGVERSSGSPTGA